MAEPRNLFGDGRAGERIAGILANLRPAQTQPSLELNIA